MISKACVVGAYQTKLEALAAQGDIELSIIVPPYWREGRQRLVLEQAHAQGYALIVAPMALNGHFHTHFYPTLPSILRRTRPDICHIDEEPYNLATYLAVRTSEKVGAKSVFFTWQNLLRNYPWPFHTMERAVYAQSVGAMAGNQEAEAILREKGFVHPVKVIPQFGVDPDLFQPDDDPRPERPFTIGYAGRLVEQKGVRILAQSLLQLAGEWRWLICGSGPLQSELVQQFASAGSRHRVQFMGQLLSEEMPKFLRQLDLLILPSLTRPNWKEQFGRVLVEAMACGVPVIGSSSGEIPHVIGEGGLIVTEGDVDALWLAIQRLRDNTDERLALGQAGRQRVLERFTQSIIAEQTATFYREMLHAS